MSEGTLRGLDSTHSHRNDALRRLVERYELGELSDEDFTKLKQQILRYGAIAEGTQSAQIELIVATYSDTAVVDEVLETLRTPQKRQSPRIIDVALLSRYGSGMIRIGLIPELTRPIVAGTISIVAAMCGLLFPLKSLLSQHAGTPLAASFSSFAPYDDEQLALRSIGDLIPNGTTSIVVVCWTVVAHTLRTAFGNADQVMCRTLGDVVTRDISDVLTVNADRLGQCDKPGDG